MMRVQKPVGYFVRAVLLMPLYVPLFAPKASSSATAGSVYTIVLKVRPLSALQEQPCHAWCASALSACCTPLAGYPNSIVCPSLP